MSFTSLCFVDLVLFVFVFDLNKWNLQITRPGISFRFKSYLKQSSYPLKSSNFGVMPLWQKSWSFHQCTIMDLIVHVYNFCPSCEIGYWNTLSSSFKVLLKALQISDYIPLILLHLGNLFKNHSLLFLSSTNLPLPSS